MTDVIRKTRNKFMYEEVGSVCSVGETKFSIVGRELRDILVAFLRRCKIYTSERVESVIKNIFRERIFIKDHSLMISFPRDVIEELSLEPVYTVRCMPGAPAATLWGELTRER